MLRSAGVLNSVHLSEDNITKNLSSTNKIEHYDVLEKEEAEIKSNELKLIKENDPQYVGELSKEEEEDAEMEGEEIEEEKDEKNKVKECDIAYNIKEIAQFIPHIDCKDYDNSNVKKVAEMEDEEIEEEKDEKDEEEECDAELEGEDRRREGRER